MGKCPIKLSRTLLHLQLLAIHRLRRNSTKHFVRSLQYSGTVLTITYVKFSFASALRQSFYGGTNTMRLIDLIDETKNIAKKKLKGADNKCSLWASNEWMNCSPCNNNEDINGATHSITRATRINYRELFWSRVKFRLQLSFWVGCMTDTQYAIRLAVCFMNRNFDFVTNGKHKSAQYIHIPSGRVSRKLSFKSYMLICLALIVHWLDSYQPVVQQSATVWKCNVTICTVWQAKGTVSTYFPHSVLFRHIWRITTDILPFKKGRGGLVT